MSRKDKLWEIAKKIESCRKCSLYKKATKPVPGEGSSQAEIFFVGEGPGFHEDYQGRPFVGAAGKLLDKMLEEIDLKREEVFIGNMIKHRPPGNRDPEPEEIAACQGWLDQQLDIIKPKLIVTLGRFSMAKFIPETKISQVHGQPRLINFQERRSLVVPMYHPAAALRNGNIMQEFKDDFVKLPQLLERFKKITEQLPEMLETEEIGKQENHKQQMSLI